jgi:tetratricopeptide (TPR) repeat protein
VAGLHEPGWSRRRYPATRHSTRLSDFRNAVASDHGRYVAFDAYLQGRALYHQDSGEQSDRAALSLYDAAIAADPTYALAHAARARALVTIAGQYSLADALPALYDAAESAARRAVAIAPDLADAHSALADVLFSARLKIRAARESYDRAYGLGAGDADLLSAFAFYCAQCGRAKDALAAITRAVMLDPLNARAYQMTGWVNYAARRYSESIPPLQHALSLNSKLSNAHASIGDAYLQMGRVREAHDAYLLEPTDVFRLTGLAITERRLGNDAAAREANARLISQSTRDQAIANLRMWIPKRTIRPTRLNPWLTRRLQRHRRPLRPQTRKRLLLLRTAARISATTDSAQSLPYRWFHAAAAPGDTCDSNSLLELHETRICRQSGAGRRWDDWDWCIGSE